MYQRATDLDLYRTLFIIERLTNRGFQRICYLRLSTDFGNIIYRAAIGCPLKLKGIGLKHLWDLNNI